VRIPSGVALLLSFTTAMFVTADVAEASSTGGTASSSHTASSSPANVGGAAPSAPAGNSKKAARVVHGAPVTGRNLSLLYTGPVYQKLATGQVVAYTPPPPVGQLAPATGGSPVGATAQVAPVKPQLLVPGTTARVVDGLAAAPMSVPAPVQAIIWAGNQIIGLPYIFGGGHASFTSPGYDCSGTVSFALHGASLLSTPMDSSEFMAWGGGGIGQWVTIFSNPEHAYMTVAGLRLDTSAADDPSNQQGPRWRPLRPANGGFKVRHPVGL
jgi:hypothetical protein